MRRVRGVRVARVRDPCQEASRDIGRERIGERDEPAPVLVPQLEAHSAQALHQGQPLHVDPALVWIPPAKASSGAAGLLVKRADAERLIRAAGVSPIQAARCMRLIAASPAPGCRLMRARRRAGTRQSGGVRSSARVIGDVARMDGETGGGGLAQLVAGGLLGGGDAEVSEGAEHERGIRIGAGAAPVRPKPLPDTMPLPTTPSSYLLGRGPEG